MGVISSGSTYAIRAALYVASSDLGQGEYVSTRQIAEDLEVPFPFLSKVLQGLCQDGILVSSRGPAGGVALGRDASEITLIQIVESTGGGRVFAECVLGLPACSDGSPCALHEQWRAYRSEMESLFAKNTLAMLAAGGTGSPLMRRIGGEKARRGHRRR